MTMNNANQDYLTQSKIGKIVDIDDLCDPISLQHLAFSFTNRCNLRCIYCPQGTHPDEFHADTPDLQIKLILDYIDRHDIRKVSIGYYGETMLVPGWERYCLPLLGKGIDIVFVSSFSRVMTPDEVAVVSRFGEIEISIDSVDADILRSVRKAVDVRTILYNTHLIRAHIIAHDLPMPRLIWTAVLTDRVVNGLPDLVAMAISSGIVTVNVNDLAYFKGTGIGDTGHVADMSDALFPAAFLAVQKARRMARRHGVNLTITGMDRLERRARAVLKRAEYGRAVGSLEHVDDVDPNRPVFIYGAGEAGRRLYRVLAAATIAVAGFIDSARDGEWDGVPISSLETYRRQAGPDDQILIASMYEEEIEKALSRAGIDTGLRAHRVAMMTLANPLPSVVPAATDAEAAKAKTWRQGIQGQYVCADDASDDVPAGYTRQCLSPWTEIYFDPKGEVYSCCFRGIAMAKLSGETGIDAVRNDAPYRRLRHSLLTGENLDPECSRCTGHRIVPVAEFQDSVRGVLTAGQSIEKGLP
ncbi:radical SAM protein [Azospirillum sp. TSO5]|uniref:radical SAM protein n=1 Tax=Azospirillum sp. TSO5 TaxID=716760 RepID=UPI000D6541DF|nr:radical SAM protein [Azospirillum sp. TSO5]